MTREGKSRMRARPRPRANHPQHPRRAVPTCESVWGFFFCLRRCGSGFAVCVLRFATARRGCWGWFARGRGRARIRDLPSRVMRPPCGVFVLTLAFAVCVCLCVFAGIRDALSRSTRRPCAGRHLLFFAAAKKSRQKKAAHTASSFFCLRAPKGSYASHGNFPVRVRCQRSCDAPHPLHAPASHQAVPNSPRPPRWQTVCRLSRQARKPTHSLPPGRHIPFAAAGSCTGIRSG